MSSEKYLTINASFNVDDHINKNSNKFSKNINRMNIEFKDSLQFLSASLANLVTSLQKDDFIHTSNLGWSDNIINKKGIFPYSYIDNIEKLKEDKLPIKESFFDDLQQSHISDNEYNRALQVWQELECNTLEDYMLSYLKLDVYQLADVFERFRKDCLE